MSIPAGVAADGTLHVVKYGATIPVSRQTLVDQDLVELTPEEQRERAARHADMDRRAAAATAAWPVFVAQLAAVRDPVGRAVLDLHREDDGYCRGDDFDGYEAEPPAWPCSTVDAVAEALGIPMPPDLWLAEQGRV